MRSRRKPHWTLERWANFCRRCQGLRDRAGRFLGTIPPTKGLGARHIDAWHSACDRIVHAMIGLEDVLADQHGEGAIRIIHGPRGTSWCGAGNRCWDPRCKAILPRERWLELGCEVKAIRAENRALLVELQETVGVTSPCLRRFAAVEKALDRARCKLDSLAVLQHPGWREAARATFDTAAV